jgi:hypothetical protein
MLVPPASWHWPADGSPCGAEDRRLCVPRCYTPADSALPPNDACSSNSSVAATQSKPVLRGSGCGNCGTNPARVGGYEGRCGYGTRLPMIVVSAWAKRDFVDHGVTDQTSIIRSFDSSRDNGDEGLGIFPTTRKREPSRTCSTLMANQERGNCSSIRPRGGCWAWMTERVRRDREWSFRRSRRSEAVVSFRRTEE